MTTLLQLKDATKRYGGRVLLDGASLSVASSHKVGLIGRNGSGKTTLCRLLTGEEEMEVGEVVRHRDLRLGYLRQEEPYLPGETVLEFLRRDTGAEDWRCGEMAGRFEMKGPLLERPVDELSGGWQTRVKLAALLLADPNLLLLDEPTNFLDLRTQLLLERFLRRWSGACLVVSHDRTFLARTTDRTCELSRGRLTAFKGGIEAYLEHRRKLRALHRRRNAAVEAKARQLQRFIDRNRANPKTSSQARSKAKQLERLEQVQVEEPEPQARICVPDAEPRKGTAVSMDGVTLGYPGVEVARGVRVEILHGTRTVVVGDNGQGKTTFLSTLAETLPPLDGRVSWSHGCDVGCYAQRVYAALPEHLTVQQYLEARSAPGTSEQAVRDVAGGFLFSGGDIRKDIAVLSGGERARLCLAGLLLGGHNVLVLDEPGNHLDVETVEALADALASYRGTVVFTSHDRHFTDRVATDVIEVRDGAVASLPGSHRDYLRRIEQEVSEGQGEAAAAAETSEDEAKEAARERYRLERRATSIERRIERLERERDDLQAVFARTSDPEEAQRLHRRMEDCRGEMEALEEDWLALQEELEGLGPD